VPDAALTAVALPDVALPDVSLHPVTPSKLRLLVARPHSLVGEQSMSTGVAEEVCIRVRVGYMSCAVPGL
jgi:hypothetical protein